jgi:hypothetical protein
MAEGTPDVTLGTLHGDLTDLQGEMRTGFVDLKGEMRAGFADLKTTLVVGFSRLPTRESSEEMVRLLRAGNRLNEERFTHLDVRIREQHLETQQALHALVDGQRLLIEGQQSMSAAIKALVAALMRGRNNGEPPA